MFEGQALFHVEKFGLCYFRHLYYGHYWPEKIEVCSDEAVPSWLEQHLVLVPMEPRPAGCSVVEGRQIDEARVRALASAASDCWDAILARDLSGFARAYRASFEAQVAMFPGMIQGTVQSFIDRWSQADGVLAWKMPGAGGGGYIALVVEDASVFVAVWSEAIRASIRR